MCIFTWAHCVVEAALKVRKLTAGAVKFLTSGCFRAVGDLRFVGAQRSSSVCVDKARARVFEIVPRTADRRENLLHSPSFLPFDVVKSEQLTLVIRLDSSPRAKY